MTTTAIKTEATRQTKPAAKPAATKTTSRTRSPVRRAPAPAPASPTAIVNSNDPAAALATKVTKRDQLAAMLVRDEGATLDQMIAATGWLPHTTRAALTGLRKAGYAIDSDKIDGIRTYRAVAP